MAKRNKDENIHDDGTYVVKKNRTESIIALVVCVLIAFAIWVYAKNTELREDGADKGASQDQHTQQNVGSDASGS